MLPTEPTRVQNPSPIVTIKFINKLKKEEKKLNGQYGDRNANVISTNRDVLLPASFQ